MCVAPHKLKPVYETLILLLETFVCELYGLSGPKNYTKHTGTRRSAPFYCVSYGDTTNQLKYTRFYVRT